MTCLRHYLVSDPGECKCCRPLYHRHRMVAKRIIFRKLGRRYGTKGYRRREKGEGVGCYSRSCGLDFIGLDWIERASSLEHGLDLCASTNNPSLTICSLTLPETLGVRLSRTSCPLTMWALCSLASRYAAVFGIDFRDGDIFLGRCSCAVTFLFQIGIRVGGNSQDFVLVEVPCTLCTL